jgi:hypothetical protein
VNRYADEIGQLDWAAPMDWMCEPWIVEKTGLSVREHQERTVANYLALRDRGPFIPVLQGWTLEDYETCVDLYAQAGVDLSAELSRLSDSAPSVAVRPRPRLRAWLARSQDYVCTASA